MKVSPKRVTKTWTLTTNSNLMKRVNKFRTRKMFKKMPWKNKNRLKRSKPRRRTSLWTKMLKKETKSTMMSRTSKTVLTMRVLRFRTMSEQNKLRRKSLMAMSRMMARSTSKLTKKSNLRKRINMVKKKSQPIRMIKKVKLMSRSLKTSRTTKRRLKLNRVSICPQKSRRNSP